MHVFRRSARFAPRGAASPCATPYMTWVIALQHLSFQAATPAFIFSSKNITSAPKVPGTFERFSCLEPHESYNLLLCDLPWFRRLKPTNLVLIVLDSLGRTEESKNHQRTVRSGSIFGGNFWKKMAFFVNSNRQSKATWVRIQACTSTAGNSLARRKAIRNCFLMRPPYFLAEREKIRQVEILWAPQSATSSHPASMRISTARTH